MRSIGITGLVVTLSCTCTAARAREEPGGVQPPTRRAHKVALLHRTGCREYERVAEAFTAESRASVRVFFVAPDDDQMVRSRITRLRPHLIAAVGQTAFEEALSLDLRVPVLHMLVFHGVGAKDRPDHIGISGRVPAAHVLSTFRLARADLKRIAVLHGHSSRDAWLEAARTAPELGFELDPLQARSPAHALALLQRLKPDAEGLWLMTDLKILTPQVLKLALAIQFRRRVLLMGAARRHVEQGALFAVDYCPHGLGRHAARVANQVLAGSPVPPPAAAETVRLSVNQGTARTLRVPTAALRGAKAALVR